MDIFNLICFIALIFYPIRGEKVLRCFDCAFDMKNEHCDDRFNTIGIKVINCTGSCVKVKMYNEDKEKVYGRYCSPTREKEQCRITDSRKQQRMEECYCNKDLCNAASTKTNGFTQVAAFIILISVTNLLCPVSFMGNCPVDIRIYTT